MNRGRKWVRWVFVLLGLLAVLVIAAVGTVYATRVTWLARAIVSANTPGRVTGKLGVIPDGVRPMRVEVGPPDVSLSVWIIDPVAKVRGTVLLLHGVHGGKGSMLGTGRTLAQQGFRAVLVDLRGHGASTGEWLTFGVVESRDLSQVLDALEREKMLVAPVGVHGESYGGAMAIMLAGRDPRVRAVVSVAGFATMRDEVPYLIRHAAKMPAWLLTDNTIARAIDEAGRLAGFNPDDSNPLAAIQRTDAPVLLIHGDPDEKVPVEHSRQLHAAAPGHSQLIIVPSTRGHDAFFRDHRAMIAQAASEWFGKWLVSPDSAATMAR